MRGPQLARAVSAVLVATTTLIFGAGAAFAPPAGAVAHARDVTGTITLDGTPLMVRLTTAGQNGQIGFAGTSGQAVSVVVTQSTVGPGCPALLISLVRPNGSAFGTTANTCAGSAFLDTQTLDATGNWTILLDPQGSAVGHLTLQAYAVTDETGVIARNGISVPVKTTTPGQNARFTFSSVTGQQVSAVLSASTFGRTCGAVTVSLVRPDGSAFGTSASTCKTGAFLDSQTLDADGNWTILVDPKGTLTGTVNLQAFNTDDAVGLTHLDGSKYSVSTTNPGEDAAVHFSGTSGQKVSALITSATFAGCPGFDLSLIRPDGSAFGNTVSSCNATAFLDAQALDQTGIWSIDVDPQGKATGTATLQAYDASDAVHPISLNGAPVNVALDPGQNGDYTFTGSVGQEVSAEITSSTIPGCTAYTLSLMRPNGSTLGTPVNGCNASGFLDTLTLDANGTWSIVVDPVGANSGTATLNGFTFSDDTGTAELSGKPAFLNFNKPGQNARWSFAGTNGEKVSAYLTDSTLTPCNVALSLVRPNGTTLGAPVSACSASVFLETQTLDQTGTWTAVVDPQGVGTGSATLQVFRVNDTSQPFKPGPSIKTFTALAPGTNASYHFNGSVGDTRNVAISGSTYSGTGCPSITVSLIRPDGSVLTSMSTCSSQLNLANVTLDAAGVWTLFIDPQGPATGTMIIRLT